MDALTTDNRQRNRKGNVFPIGHARPVSGMEDDMTEITTDARCSVCGSRVTIEDAQRTTFCDCDPNCRCCRAKFKGKKSDPLCPECMEGEREGFVAQYPQLGAQVTARRNAAENPQNIERALMEALDADIRRQWEW